MTIDFDDVLRDIGQYGRYQKIIMWSCLFPLCIPSGIHWFNQIFMQGIPEHRCFIPEIDSPDQDLSNLTLGEFIPWEEQIDGSRELSGCEMLAKTSSTNSTPNSSALRSTRAAPYENNIPCQFGWKYDEKHYTKTVVTDWNLVCDYALVPTVAFAIFGVGNLVGVFFFGYVSDRFGRKKASFCLLAVQTVFGVLSAVAPNIASWMVFRFMVGTTIPASYTIGFVMVVELVGPERRAFATVISNFFCGIGFVSCAGLAYLIRDWRYFALSTSLPFALFFLVFLFIPESPRWLLSVGKFAEAERIIRKIAGANGVVLPVNYMETLKMQSDKKEEMAAMTSGEQQEPLRQLTNEPSFRDLFATPGIRKSIIFLSVIWLMIAIAYNGMNYYSPEVGPNPYLSYALTTLTELPANFAVWPLVQHWGRRWTLITSMILGGVCCITTIFVPRSEAYSDTVMLACLLIGKFCSTCADIVIYLYSGELLPTALRSLGIGVVSTMGMLGYIVVPFVLASGRLGPAYRTIPLVAIGALMVLGALTNLFLPETLHRKLPESVEECEEQYRALRLRHYVVCCVEKPTVEDRRGPEAADQDAEELENLKSVESPSRVA
ncbi:Carcinine [Hypsibius exemplaris]|uniref:Carcinine n=1 Tax=Hypsibius exemplaris TaxID=2072580 RepID=A0A1W0WHC3_HYPEX|nr:Carcinine [Hypsibius exemplaris]